jgi:hypothetical protein
MLMGGTRIRRRFTRGAEVEEGLMREMASIQPENTGMGASGRGEGSRRRRERRKRVGCRSRKKRRRRGRRRRRDWELGGS